MENHSEFQIVKCKKPNMPLPNCSCDNRLCDRLEQYELLKFLNTQSSLNLFCGKPGSGKSSTVNGLFAGPLMNTYSKIYLFMPKHSRQSFEDSIFNCLPDEQVFDDLDLEILTEVVEICKADAEIGFKSAIIFDDQTAKLKNNELLKTFLDICYNRRHYKISIFFIVQSFYSVPKSIRQVFTNIFLFRISKNVLNNIYEELIECPNKELVDKLCKFVFNQKYNFLFINCDTQRFFKNFDEIIIPE